MSNRTTVPINVYSKQFFSEIQAGSFESARQTLPLIIQWLSCKTIVDVGCGVGTWLKVCKELGVNYVRGLDGDYIRREQLQVDPSEFRAVNLESPPSLHEVFDLAISLEVAEHLPESAADQLVAYLVSAAPAVLFSAAIPGQGGTLHKNEQWPDYWATRFEQHGFSTLDCLRPRLWNNESVEWWYAQNMFLYVRKDRLEENPTLLRLFEETDRSRLAIVHPRAFMAKQIERIELEDKLRPQNMRFVETLRMLPTVFAGALGRRLARHSSVQDESRNK